MNMGEHCIVLWLLEFVFSEFYGLTYIVLSPSSLNLFTDILFLKVIIVNWIIFLILFHMEESSIASFYIRNSIVL
jgi:hypothetical protein